MNEEMKFFKKSLARGVILARETAAGVQGPSSLCLLHAIELEHLLPLHNQEAPEG